MRRSNETYSSSVLEAVNDGLSKTPKRLPSWLFYNEDGDRIFQSIMQMPEYYPTRCEFEILKHNKEELLNYFTFDGSPFQLVELGAGDATKTEILLEYFVAQSVSFSYAPLDISSAVLEQLAERMRRRLPELEVIPIAGTYEDSLDFLSVSKVRKVILFLGANIGNYSPIDSLILMQRIAKSMKKGDVMLIGFDLKKDPRRIQLAYDDPHGITREFNLNLLRRLNHELGATFDLKKFSHYPTYDPVTGTAKSFLISLEEQTIFFEALGKSFHFRRWEAIQTEVSQKYTASMIEELGTSAGLDIAEILYDSRRYFCDVILKK